MRLDGLSVVSGGVGVCLTGAVCACGGRSMPVRGGLCLCVAVCACAEPLVSAGAAMPAGCVGPGGVGEGCVSGVVSTPRRVSTRGVSVGALCACGPVGARPVCWTGTGRRGM
ncbi:hypothetical protein GCM10023259_079780 [Thermocatellispora tengchongensis]